MLLWIVSSSLLSSQEENKSDDKNNPSLLRQQQRQLNTPKFAPIDDDKVLNVHIVPHTHDDVGWLKTVEQYFYGHNLTIQQGYVRLIIDSFMAALLDNPNRTFTYVEQKFFSMWWKSLSSSGRNKVRDLVHGTTQLSFVNGGWCMHDEATTHFMGMVDQTTLGHTFLLEELNVIPTVGWQLDPFGHSSTQASYMTSLMGFNALYFGRIDYQDLQLRHETRECEGLWDSSPTVGDPIFWGLTGSYEGQYGPPRGFCFDLFCGEGDLLVDLDDDILLNRMNEFVARIELQSNRSKGNHIMLTMGEDFQYQTATQNFENLDLLIDSVLRFQESGKLNAPWSYEKISVFYSSPDFYTEMKHKQTMRVLDHQPWTTKSDDFFPYADQDHAYWTGYYTSRPTLKRLERVGSSFLMAARQLASLQTIEKIDTENENCDVLSSLEDAMGVAQHHDAVAGTSKQHVADDYVRRINSGMDKAKAYLTSLITKLLQSEDEGNLMDVMVCENQDDLSCGMDGHHKIIAGDLVTADRDMYVVLYNALAQIRKSLVRLPVAASGVYEIESLQYRNKTVTISDIHHGKEVLYVESGPIPPTGSVAFRIRKITDATTPLRSPMTPFGKTTVSNGLIELGVESNGGILTIRNLNDKGTKDVKLKPRWGYYTSFDRDRNPLGGQNSGAYLFRPDRPHERPTQLRPIKASQRSSGPLQEILVVYEQPWISQILRLLPGKTYIEVEWTVGPIPVQDGIGKEVVLAYDFDINNNGIWYTDANGREFQRRKRSFRPTWNMTESEPISGNYYPVNTAAYIEDDDTSAAVIVDRSQGVSSLTDGSLEFMVHRRILADDGRGVGEALNETTGGMQPYPPFGNAERIGDGLRVRGTHRLLCGAGNSGASLARGEMDDAFSHPLVFVTSTRSGSGIPLRRPTFSLLNATLPPNIMLITFAPLHKEHTFLLRLAHQYATDEDSDLSMPVTVCLFNLIGKRILKVRERNLSGNQDYNEWIRRRMVWTHQFLPKSKERSLSVTEDGSCLVTLKPMEVRTFEVKLDITD